MLFFLNDNIQHNKSGIEHAQIKRLHLFEMFDEPAKIVTRKYSNELHMVTAEAGIADEDFVNLFEPNATLLEKEEYGYVVASIGELSGEMPYTAFYARKSYLNENKETLIKFNNAINKGLEFVKNNDARTIAEKILPQFPDTSLDDLEKIVQRYKDSDSWLETTYISEEYFTNLEDLMIENDLLEEYVPYKDLIQNLNNE